MPRDTVTYYHIELARHDVILAEGLPAESYLDTGDRSNFTNGGDLIRLFPDFSSDSPVATAMWEAKGCAPLIVTGPKLATMRHMLDKRAAVLELQNADILEGSRTREHKDLRGCRSGSVRSSGRAAGCQKIYEDRISGAKAARSNPGDGDGAHQ